MSKEMIELAGELESARDEFLNTMHDPIPRAAAKQKLLQLLWDDKATIIFALRASTVAEPVACQADHCPWFEMIWDWLGSEDRYGARNMISDFPDGATTDDLRRMLDEHESEIVAQIKPSHPAPAAPVPASEALELIKKRLADLREANAIYRKSEWYRLDEIQRNDREIRWLVDLNTLLHPPAPEAAPTREEIIEQCAKFVEQHQETIKETSSGSERYLSPRKVGNLMGTAYVDGLRALKAAPHQS